MEQTLSRLMKVPELNLTWALHSMKSRLGYNPSIGNWCSAITEMAKFLNIPNAQEFIKKLERAQKFVEQIQNAHK